MLPISTRSPLLLPLPARRGALVLLLAVAEREPAPDDLEPEVRAGAGAREDLPHPRLAEAVVHDRVVDVVAALLAVFSGVAVAVAVAAGRAVGEEVPD